MLDALKQMVSSKKWIGAIIMIVIGVLVNQKVITPDLGQTIEIALGIGIAGQAIADHGKSAAQIAAAPKPIILPLAPVPPPADKAAA
jgi:hypothetical protein